ncbi:hypothetical protein FSARC_863 [Fusarium sarcochroum]|uniref:AB hydrolase-1 domain-containing protein n=1 Tax=Fusarium sarcochroum TaxID=1208366 RepID=A0A8H4XFK9_9HYPO|nr:hypothetical protein FSARC_863 [Fusarium sarcochroum]
MALKIEEFDFSFTDSQVADLKERIDKTRLPNQAISPLLDGWDYDIHFIHVESKSPTATPILLVHGWPGSFYEFKYVIDELANPKNSDDQAFHVVVPSLPGYTFSQSPQERGWSMKDNARIFNKLMVGLGYSEYMCQGGDWGHQVCRYLGSKFTKNCRRVHVNMCPAPPPKSFMLLQSSWVPASIRDFFLSWLYTPIERMLCQRSLDFGANGFAYAHIQGTKPATLGWGLMDSPVGHLSWLGEKWMAWSDHDDPSPTLFDKRGREDQHLSYDILANVSLYWFTESILTSFLPYLENRDWRHQEFVLSNMTSVSDADCYISVPMGVSSFKFELAGSTKGMVAKSGNIKFYKEHSKGGHFAALDRPQVLLEDIREFYRLSSSGRDPL